MKVTARTVDLAARILARLRGSKRPVKRRELATLVDEPNMKQSTKERRVREARAYLVSMGHPVLSDGTGFRIARTPEEFQAAIRLKEQAARAAFIEVAHLKKLSPKEYAAQLLLEFEAAG